MLKVGNQKSQLYLNNKELGEFFVNKLAYYSDNYKFSKAYKSGRWDGKIRFGNYHHPFLSFGTGLLIDVLNLLQRNNIDYIVKDTRIKPSKEFNTCTSFTLRPYQQEAVEAAIKNQRGVIWSPTASGKTVTFVSLIAELGVPTIILVRNKDLMMQTMSRVLDDLKLESVGCIGDGIIQPAEFVTVGMLQTLSSMRENNPKEFLKLMSYFQCLIVDEAHAINANAKTFTKVVENIPSFYRFAFTATPKRTEHVTATDVTLTSCFGPVLYHVSRHELVEQGYLVDTNIVIVLNRKSSGMTREDYLQNYESPQEAYRAAWKDYILNDVERVPIIKSILKKHKDEQILIMCDSVDLAKKFGEELGIQVVTGATESTLRESIYNDFRSGEIKQLIATNIYSEGVDFTKLNVVILAEPFKSTIKLLQRIGRGMRIHEGKDTSIVYDIADINSPFFDRQFAHRKKLYDKEEIIYTFVKGDSI